MFWRAPGIFLLLFSTLVFAQNHPTLTAKAATTKMEAPAPLMVGEGPKSLESELVGNEQRIADSEKNKDQSFLAEALADNFIYVAYNGLVLTKDKIVQSLKFLDISNYQMENFKLRSLDENSAVLTYDLIIEGAIGGRELPHRQYASSVWVRKAGHWIMVLHQETPAKHS